jgi:hypothetical protein
VMMLESGDNLEMQRMPLRDLDLPMTAHEALRWALPAATERDPDARMVLITSGEDLDATGRSYLWEFHLDLPIRRAHVTLHVGQDDDPDADTACALVVQMRPFVPPSGDLWEIMAQGEEAVRRYVLTHWQRQLAGRPPLPLPGYDSPRAMAALLNQGAEVGRGRYLGARVQVDGTAAWYIQAGNRVFTTPFGPLALPGAHRAALAPPSLERGDTE